MKRYFCFFLAVLITAMSIILYYPFNIYANDAFTISKNSTEKTGLTADEAQKAIDANADIKGKDGVTMLLYTPSDSYNYTLKSGAFVAHLSDSQAKAMLMSKKSFQQYVVLCSSLISNGTVFRGFLKTVGIATTGDSDALTNIVDKFTCNYNYIDSINYDEDTQTITMDNSSVDKLRKEIKQYYYDSIGIVQYQASGTFSDYINGRYFSHLFEYDEDYGEALSKVKNYKYALADSYINGNVDTSEHAYLWDSSSYIYLSDIKGFAGTSSYGNVVYRLNVYIDGASSNLTDNLTYYYYYGIDNNSYSTFKDNIYGLYIDPNGSYYNKIYPCISDKTESFKPYFNYIDAYPCFRYTDFKFYSYDGEPLLFFKSFSSMYNYLNGDQNAFLSSEIKKTGEDITFSIKDMNENLGNKMDTLIDSINSNKSNMSADELQNAIDKGLEDLNKNTEDIKDNTEEMNNKLDSVLEALNTQNATLLEILGVTKKIADTVDDIDENANFSSLMSLLSTVFLGIQNAILYGQNTMNNDNSTDAQAVIYDEDEIAVYSSGGGTSLDYRGGIFGHFPFSVIYHLYDWLKVLQTEPKCPEFSYNYGFMIGKKDDTECQITFDLSQYESWRDVISSLTKLSFTLAVAVGTYKKFKGGDLS